MVFRIVIALQNVTDVCGQRRTGRSTSCSSAGVSLVPGVAPAPCRSASTPITALYAVKSDASRSVRSGPFSPLSSSSAASRNLCYGRTALKLRKP